MFGICWCLLGAIPYHCHTQNRHSTKINVIGALSNVPTANSTIPITQIPRPSSTDQALHDLFLTESPHVWSTNNWVLVELIGYRSTKQNFYPDHSRSLHYHFPINSISTTPIANHFPNFPIASRVLAYLIATRLILTVKNYRVGSPIDADHPDHLPDQFLID